MYGGLLTSERHGVGEEICLGRVTRHRIGIQLCNLSLVRAKTQLSRHVTVDSHLGFLQLNIKIFVDRYIPQLFYV